jgi:hypothetical protein
MAASCPEGGRTAPTRRRRKIVGWVRYRPDMAALRTQLVIMGVISA